MRSVKICAEMLFLVIRLFCEIVVTCCDIYWQLVPAKTGTRIHDILSDFWYYKLVTVQ